MAIPIKYSNYSNVFLAEYTMELSKYTEINNHAIELEKNKQLFFGRIYNLRLVELETLKIYIEINLANSFIRPSKFSARATILFDWKPDKSLYFYVDY